LEDAVIGMSIGGAGGGDGGGALCGSAAVSASITASSAACAIAAVGSTECVFLFFDFGRGLGVPRLLVIRAGDLSGEVSKLGLLLSCWFDLPCLAMRALCQLNTVAGNLANIQTSVVAQFESPTEPGFVAVVVQSKPWHGHPAQEPRYTAADRRYSADISSGVAMPETVESKNASLGLMSMEYHRPG
jgi:hypothetical protein